MAGVKISNLPAATTPLGGTEAVPMVQSGVTVKATPANINAIATYTGTGTGAVSRLVSSKLGDVVSVKDFGAVGDGATNDTAAIQASVNYIAATGNNVFVPPGTYLTDPFVLTSAAYSLQGSFFGSDRERCIIKRRVAGAGVFVTIGSASSTIFQAGVGFSGLTLDGGVVTNGDTLVTYDVVRSTFDNCRFKGGAVACHMYGGVSVTFKDCAFEGAGVGLKIEKFTSLAGGGWPNLIRVRGGEAVDNTVWGVYFDFGRVLRLEDVQIEGNGTTGLGASQGGVFIGSNVGTEVSATDTYSLGLVASGCWFEANLGAADISLNSGLNSVSDSNFFSTNTQTVNDIVINGGRFMLRNLNMSFTKTANVLENAGSIVGNLIEGSDIPNLNTSSAKTTIFGLGRFNQRGGAIPVVPSLTNPLVQVGGTTTGATGVSVTFPTAFTSVPTVLTALSNGDTTTVVSQVIVSNITATGFFARGLGLTSGSSIVVQSNIGFTWAAIGTT